jgi:DNA polymerase-3 subunit delta'
MRPGVGKRQPAPTPAPVWETIVGQPSAVNLLRRAIATDRVAHAYAFIGPPAVGRRRTALAFAQACLCDGLGCGSCAVCRRVSTGQHPDCVVVAPVAPRDNPRGASVLRIEQVREVRHWAALAPREGRRKVFVLDDADHMTAPAAHALLKTLEEPPPRTLLILTIANSRSLPATVLSRCQPVRFRPLGEAEAAAVIGARGADPETARLLAHLCRGQVGLAMETDIGAVRAQRAGALDLLEVPPAQVGARLDDASLDRVSVAAYLETYWLWYRDALCLAAGGDPRLLVNIDRRDDLAALASRLSPVALTTALDEIKRVWLGLEGNLNPRLALECMLLALSGVPASPRSGAFAG